VLVLIGVAVAVVMYLRRDVPQSAPENVSVFTRIARRDLLQDDFNEALFMRPGQALTRTLVAVDDAVIDGAVRGVGKLTLGTGNVLRETQTGFVRSYAMWILIGAIGLIGAIWVVTQ
jgi:NADH-quinone oxidoreductase subunit L